MTPLRRALAFLAAASLSMGAPGARSAQAPDPAEIPWRPLAEALASKGAIEAKFTERRFFSFRREPTVLTGVIRVSADRGLSLQYTAPEASEVIVDAAGLVIRDARGRERELPASSRDGGAIAALLPIMRFDIAALIPRFEMRATLEGSGWKIDFTPRDPEAARSLGLISIEGSMADVTHISIRKSASQRIEIDVGETRSGVTFTPDELARHFRRTGKR